MILSGIWHVNGNLGLLCKVLGRGVKEEYAVSDESSLGPTELDGDFALLN